MSHKTERAAENCKNDVMEKENVVGVAGGEDKVLVLVTEKKPLDELRDEDVVPETVEEVETDVIEVGKIEAKAKVGDSIGLRDAGTGTLGCIVRDAHRTYILTNNHVAADSNRARVLSNIHTPGNADGLGGVLGRLARFEPIFFDRPNYIDAALVEVDRTRVEEAMQSFRSRTAFGRTGWMVHKTGRTTGYTEGEIIGRNASVNVDFGSQGVARFDGQLLTTYMLDSGDSGSVLASKNNHAVALCFAGSDTVSIHNPISRVLRTLGVIMG